MSHEGFVLIVRAVLVLGLILATAIVRTFIGPSTKRGFVMSAGMLGGTALGVAFSYLVPASVKMKESAVFAISGLLLGWGVGWFLARNISRREE